MRVLRVIFYVTIFIVTTLLPPGGSDTKQPRDVAKLLITVIGVIGVSVAVAFLTAPRVPP